jgi:ISXO2 transposase-like protein/transposase-like zinc ribbon protein
MSGEIGGLLASITTVEDMVMAFKDEDRCRRLLEAMVWPTGRICPGCGYRRSTSLMGRDKGKRVRPGLYQCSNSACRLQFTATTRTPLHSTKLPLRVWLTGLWYMLQSDKGISSVRLAEALGVSQPTAWRMGHALRLMVGLDRPLDGVVELDEFFFGRTPGRSLKRPNPKPEGKRRSKTKKTPALCVVQRPSVLASGAPAGAAGASIVDNLSEVETERVLSAAVDPAAHLMSDEWAAFVSVGAQFAAHDTVRHSIGEYARGQVHANSAEGFNDRVRRTVGGVFHHISPRHADLYFNEIGFRWAQRVVTGQAIRRTRKGREVTRTLWSRVPPAMQLKTVFRAAIGRQMRRTKDGSVSVISAVAAFGL